MQWAAPSSDPVTNFGTAYTSYSILIQSGADPNVFYADLTNCDGSSPAVMSGLSCHIPISVLLGTPYMISIGSSVQVKVAALNVVGTSPYSQVGNGAVITMSFVPDAPINLARDEVETTRTQVGLLWTSGASHGGQPILDYRVSFDQGSGNWVVL